MSDITLETEVRLSYTALIEPKAQNEGDDPKFQTAILIPKGDTATVAAVEKAIEAALKDGIVKLWKGKTPPNLRNPLRNGDDPKANGDDPDEAYKGHWFLNAKGPKGGEKRPVLLDKNAEETRDDSVIYSGVWGRAQLQFYPYDVSGNRGVACSIQSFMSSERGESLGGNIVTANSARAAFGVTTPASDAAAAFAGGGESEPEGNPDDPWGKTE